MGLFKTARESLISIDVGASSVKLVEIDINAGRPQLKNVAIASFDQEVFSNNVITKPEYVAEHIMTLLETNELEDKRVVTAMPGPTVFTKKVKMQKMPLKELDSNIRLEAGNFIPHNIDAVRLDYHVLNEVGKNRIEVLVVAVKNEIIDSFTECFALAGLEVAVIDVDYFAMQSAFEISYPDLVDETVALINMGSRYSSVNITQDGGTLFTGNLSVGGKLFNDALVQELGISNAEAEEMKKQDSENASAMEVLSRNVDYVASEFNRQLSFFWNASGAEEGIDRILLSGGGAQVQGLLDDLSVKTGLECELLDPLKNVELGDDFDQTFISEVGSQMAVAIGMGGRSAGDRIIPEFMD